ncbi:retrovirus-related pol polyprotein from transposon TNT 1-94 [Tanacetum coccineum]
MAEDGKKLREPLAEAKPTGMKAEDWALLDRQALGAVRLSLAKNVAYNVVNEKTTYGLLKALSNMYEKPSASNKYKLFCYSLRCPRAGHVTTVSGSTGSTKLKFDNIRDLILGEDIRRKTSGEYSNYLLSAEDKGRGRKDKEVNIAARDYDDALVCCVENTIDDRIIDSGASFHATYCKEEFERFKLRSGKVCLAGDKTLDIAGVGDVVLKTSFGTNWTLKDVRYIPGLKKRLISVGHLDEEGYHVGFGDQQWKVTKGSLVVARGNKRESLYMVEVPSDGINAAINGRGNATLWHQRLGHMSVKGMKILALNGRILDLQKAVVGFCEPCVLGKQKKVSFVKSGNTRKLQRLEPVHTKVYGPKSAASIGESRYYVTFIDDCSRKSKEYEASCRATAAYLINREPSVPLGLRIPEEEWQGKEVSLAHLRVFGCDSYVKSHKVVRSRDVTFNEDSQYGAKASTDFSNLTKPNQKDQVVLENSPDNLANKSIVTEHGLSSKITHSPCRSSDASEGSENSGSFEDSGRSDEEDSEDRASSEEGGSETPQLRRSTRESRAPAPRVRSFFHKSTKGACGLAQSPKGCVGLVCTSRVERAKSMRLHVGLLKMIRDDPITTTAYLINRGSSVLLGFRIPKGDWQGMEVSLVHLRVFGCDSYVKVKDVARDNLDAKSVKCTFIGYGSDEIGYRFWDSKGHKVVRSRDVTFNEDSLCGAKAATDSSNLTKPYQKDQVVLEDSPKNLANKCIVVEHGLSSKINLSLGGSSDTSEGSENSGSFEDSGSSDEEDSKDRASFEEEGS